MVHHVTSYHLHHPAPPPPCPVDFSQFTWGPFTSCILSILWSMRFYFYAHYTYIHVLYIVLSHTDHASWRCLLLLGYVYFMTDLMYTFLYLAFYLVAHLLTYPLASMYTISVFYCSSICFFHTQFFVCSSTHVALWLVGTFYTSVHISIHNIIIFMYIASPLFSILFASFCFRYCLYIFWHLGLMQHSHLAYFVQTSIS